MCQELKNITVFVSTKKERREMTKSEMHVLEQRKVFGAKIKNMWHGQLFDPSIHE